MDDGCGIQMGQATPSKFTILFKHNSEHNYTVMPEPGGPGGPLAPPIFGRLGNPI